MAALGEERPREPGAEADLRPRAIAGLALGEARRLCGGPYRLQRGILVAVEGIDGAGVSTTAEALARVLDSMLEAGGACYTKEPTYGPVGFLIWQALSGGYMEPLRLPQMLGLLFAADRLWHLTAEAIQGARGVLGCLARPAVVVSDRYKYSSLAYQQVSGLVADRRIPGAPREWLEAINSYAPPAHFLVYVDVPVEVALSRVEGERWVLHLYERRAYLEEVRRRFEDLLDSLAGRPEAPARAPWAALLEAWGLDPSEAYPGGGYPILLRLDGTGSPVENVARAACGILRVASERGLVSSL
ncbi:MAG: dTMP kinase [Desulfurococcales archaeon]|nr:dTMP kinase [Desulfurococcales archaeon]